MRKFLIPLLLASALAPAAANAEEPDVDRGKPERAERSSQRDRGSDAKQQRSHSIEQADRGAKTDRPARAERPASAEPTARVEQPGRADGSNRTDRVQRAERPARSGRVERDVQPVEQAQAPDLVQPTQPTQRTGNTIIDNLQVQGRDQQRDHDGDAGHDDGRWRDRDGNHHDWSRNWRKDHRYDWHRHRSRYSSLFRLGSYYDPYGWGYRRWSIGFSLWPSYYGSNYWLDDPWMYRLPPVYGPYRWVRYYDDALLVNTYTGQVVDVIYNFFW